MDSKIKPPQRGRESAGDTVQSELEQQKLLNTDAAMELEDHLHFHFACIFPYFENLCESKCPSFSFCPGPGLPLLFHTRFHLKLMPCDVKDGTSADRSRTFRTAASVKLSCCTAERSGRLRRDNDPPAPRHPPTHFSLLALLTGGDVKRLDSLHSAVFNEKFLRMSRLRRRWTRRSYRRVRAELPMAVHVPEV